MKVVEKSNHKNCFFIVGSSNTNISDQGWIDRKGISLALLPEFGILHNISHVRKITSHSLFYLFKSFDFLVFYASKLGIILKVLSNYFPWSDIWLPQFLFFLHRLCRFIPHSLCHPTLEVPSIAAVSLGVIFCKLVLLRTWPEITRSHLIKMVSAAYIIALNCSLPGLELVT